MRILGVDFYRVSHTERLVSAAGAFIGILAIMLISSYFLEDRTDVILIASMGASAVLLFAVPHGALSQPWALVGGHLVSALIGVSCAKLIPEVLIVAPLAVGLAVGAMHYLRCIHPPGGATALVSVIGGPEITALGYGFVITPVLINVLAILLTAVLFNYIFAWRRYPAYLGRRKMETEIDQMPDAAEAIAREDFVSALSEIDSYIDVTEDDLLTIYQLVTQRREGAHLRPSELKLGHYYSNGQYGELWSVRQIIDWPEASTQGEPKLIYKAVAGVGRRTTGVLSLTEFANWSKYEVFLDEENWRRVSSHESGSNNQD
jgi:CBS-domain-containing membrane protein